MMGTLQPATTPAFSKEENIDIEKLILQWFIHRNLLFVVLNI